MANEHTGGMVALVPDAESARRLALPDGIASEELHLTLAYLGDDAAGFTGAQRSELLQHVQAAAVAHAPILARVFAHATFNPDRWAGREPCAVYLVGECPELTPLATRFATVAPVPQHDPFIPHMTAGVGGFFRAGDLHFTGTMVFDRLRLALGEDVVDVPLSGTLAQKGVQPPTTAREQFAAGLRYGVAGLDEDEVDAVVGDLVEFKAGPPGASFPSPDPGATRLRHFWTRTREGLAKWKPNLPGAFNRLVRHLRKYVGAQAEGLAAIYYKAAKGHWPGRHANRGRKTAMVTVTDLMLGAFEQIREDSAMQGKDTGDEFDEWGDDEEDGTAGALYASLDAHADTAERLTSDEAWEQALQDEVVWSADADGTLHREDQGDDAAAAAAAADAEDMLEMFDEDQRAGTRR